MKLGDILAGELRRLGLSRRPRQRKAARAWEQAVGSELAQQTEVVGFHRGVLTVEVANATLMSELVNFHTPALLERLSRSNEKVIIHNIRFQLKGR